MPAYSLSDLSNIRAAIAKGVTRAKIGDNLIEYRSLSEMRQIERAIIAELSPEPEKSGRYGAAWNPITGKGL